MYSQTITELSKFLRKSPTAFHAVDTMKQELEAEGFRELRESEKWALQAGDKCYVTRNSSSIIAFTVGEEVAAVSEAGTDAHIGAEYAASGAGSYSFHITCSHSDSPTFKIKQNCEIAVREKYTKLNTEVYGDLICSSWFDRPLSIAGRAVVRNGNKLETRLVRMDKDLMMIPNQAIHMNRDVNEHSSYNKQEHTLPVIAGRPMEKGELHRLVAGDLGIDVEDLVGVELYLFNRMEPTTWGIEEEFFSAAQIDDLECAFASMKALLASGNPCNVNVFACFDNEEVGSATKQGAASTMLSDVLYRINAALGKAEEDYYRAIASSFMVSCDNAHAVHPNYVAETDQDNCVYMNEGVVIKSHACQKYTSDAVSMAVFRDLCDRAGVPYQYFANRSDKTGGSTLGNLAMAQVSVNSVDIGLAQLAMHSAYETAGVKDVDYFISVLTEFYNRHIEIEQTGTYVIK